jgi:hypothetical protein
METVAPTPTEAMAGIEKAGHYNPRTGNGGPTMAELAKSDEEYAEMVEEIDEKGTGLKPWDIDFIANLIDNPPIHYSPARRQQIERIYKYLIEGSRNEKTAYL